MPYIKQAARFRLDHDEPQTAGELNFALTEVVDMYVQCHGKRYQTFNDIMGALDGAAREFYRRVVAPYEDKKIAENGDVYRIETAETG